MLPGHSGGELATGGASRGREDHPMTLARVGAGLLPAARKVLAVIARPGHESVELGALLYVLRTTGASVALLSVSRGEASALNTTCEKLECRRPWELRAAAGVLGVSSVAVADFPDGGLWHRVEEVTERVEREIRRHEADLLLVVDPFMAGSGAAVVARAASTAAVRAGVAVVAAAVPAAAGGWLADLGPRAANARAIQLRSAAEHESQAEALPAVRRHLRSLGSGERLRWLVTGHMPAALRRAGS